MCCFHAMCAINVDGGRKYDGQQNAIKTQNWVNVTFLNATIQVITLIGMERLYLNNYSVGK